MQRVLRAGRSSSRASCAMRSARVSRSRRATSRPRWRRKRARRKPADANRQGGSEPPFSYGRRLPFRSNEETRMASLPYKRVLIKLSGEALMGQEPFGIERATVRRIAEGLIEAVRLGVEVAVVVGGGNIFRGSQIAG